MKSLYYGFLVVALLSACAHQKTETNNKRYPAGGDAVIKYNYKSGEITELTQKEIKALENKIKEILDIPIKKKNFENTFVAFEQAVADFSDAVGPAGFMNDVSTKKELRKEGLESEMAVATYMVGLSTRRDIYNALLAAEKNTNKRNLDFEDKRLVEQTLKGFKHSGLILPDAELKEVRELQQQLAKLSSDFGNNIKEQTPVLNFKEEELIGAPADLINELKQNSKNKDGTLKVVVNEANYPILMQNATMSETRRRMQEAMENTAGKDNTELLVKIIALRQKIAKKLHHKTWADYMTEDRMAKSGKAAFDFLKGLREKLAERYKKDVKILLKYKKTLDPAATKLEPWDPRYLEYQMKKKFLALNNDEIKEYFPADETVKKMFEIYAQVLGLKFVSVEKADVWAPGVKLYEIREAKDNSFIAHFYTDFVPRDGKYNHFAAFPLVSGRQVGGRYNPPVAAIVGNFAPPTDGKPSLFSHDEVETLFHEFGHIMHQTLTKAKYASLSGSSVARDFVEAPSQMLENWAWDKSMIKNLSGHFRDPNKKLPDETIEKLLMSRNFNKGYFYTRQLLFGIFDMTLHTETKPVEDPTGIYKKLFKDLTGIEPLANTHFPAGFGHLMGYSAGYYGYLWSLVYADDMFTQFEKEGLLSAKVGDRYRRAILEKGDTKEAQKLIEDFLGRKPSNKAFFNRLLKDKSSAQLDALFSKAL